MTRRLLFGYLGLTLFVLLALEVPLGIQNSRTERRDLEAKVEHDATTLASIAETPLASGSSKQLAALGSIAERYTVDTGGRVVVVGRNGIAVVDTGPIDTGPIQAGRETFASRPEIVAALRGDVAQGVRFSETLHRSLLYVAVPVASGGVVEGAVRITYPTSAADARVTRYWLALLGVAAVVLILAAVVGTRLATFVIRPLRRLRTAAADIGSGDLSARAPEDEGPPEVRSLAIVFNETVGRLQTLVRSQGEFVADASHQLRTPLTALRLRLENLERELSEPGRRDLEGALAEVERLSRLVEDLLVLARADARAPSSGLVDLRRLVDERVEAWAPRAAELEVELVAESRGGGTARGSPDGLRQALDNLVENALEASPLNGVVTVRADGCELRVRDGGPGLDAEEVERAFDRFWRGRSGPGSGLGLAIVRRLVEADGGQVELRTPPGGGLEAVVRLEPPG